MWFEWDEGEDGTWLGEHGTHGDSPPRDEVEADPKRTLEQQRVKEQNDLTDSTVGVFWGEGLRNKAQLTTIFIFSVITEK